MSELCGKSVTYAPAELCQRLKGHLGPCREWSGGDASLFDDWVGREAMGAIDANDEARARRLVRAVLVKGFLKVDGSTMGIEKAMAALEMTRKGCQCRGCRQEQEPIWAREYQQVPYSPEGGESNG
jgi:hypothetical protein